MEGLVSLAKQLFSPWWGLCDRSGCELGSESCIIGWSGCFWTQAGEGSGLDPTCPPSCRQRPVWRAVGRGNAVPGVFENGVRMPRPEDRVHRVGLPLCVSGVYDVIMPFAYISMYLTAWTCSTGAWDG